jgi:hypothetical protein
MSAVQQADIAARGDRRLLSHCLDWGASRPPIGKRLEQALGPELAELLLFALVGRPRQAGRRGSSSP